MEESYCWGQLGYAAEEDEDEDEEQQGEEEGTPLHGAPPSTLKPTRVYLVLC